MTVFLAKLIRRKIMKNSLAFMSLFALSACTSVESRPEAGHNGASSYGISCHNISGTREPCLTKAEKLCKDGFSVVEKQSYKVEYKDSGDGFYMPPKHFVTVLCHPT
jgi:hypothetical protein